VKFYRNSGCSQHPSFLKHLSFPVSWILVEVKQHKPFCFLLLSFYIMEDHFNWCLTEFFICSEAFYSFLDDCRLNYPKLSVFVLSEGANEGANRQWFNHKGTVKGLFCGSELLVMWLKKNICIGGLVLYRQVVSPVACNHSCVSLAGSYSYIFLQLVF